MPNPYRYDGRSEKEFERDIKSRTQEERRLFNLWLDLIHKETGQRPTYTDTGCGKDGFLLPKELVTTDPDFDVNWYGKIEVKFASKMLDKNFHLKVGQVKSYAKSGASILMINGASERHPVFTMLRTECLEQIIRECDIISWIGFGFKMAFRIPVSKFIWRRLT